MSSRTPRPDVFIPGPEQEYPPFLAQGRGLCAGDPTPDDFTEEGDRPWQKAARERARGVCTFCPFRVPCRDWATETDQKGVYGATTTKERRARAARHKQYAD